MAENVPKPLETIIFIMDYDNPWIFSANSLRKFFEGWRCKGGEGNKMPRRLRIKRSSTSDGLLLPSLNLVAISSEHFKVIEEYGIQFDIK
ncbi:7942_t:CDS:1 [Diversispora eburnea]|uniref:7942_t:CDS:1 n=1 Tax=Diversispora eburnea TaxID=1213867 RepID=A0A9N9G998_9GLOM|nr:7942_t:CDS:1 [Diversispora eburnea]